MNLRYLLFLFVFFLAVIPAEAQCAMCRAVLESEEDGSMAGAVNDGIVYLMLFPYLFIGGVGFFIYRMYRKPKPDKN